VAPVASYKHNPGWQDRRAESAPPADILRYSRAGCDPNPATKQCLAGLDPGVQALSRLRESRWRFRDDSTMVLLGLPQPVSTLIYASATLFLASELGKLGLPRKPVFLRGNLH